jgi:hypothetical protein
VGDIADRFEIRGWSEKFCSLAKASQMSQTFMV